MTKMEEGFSRIRIRTKWRCPRELLGGVGRSTPSTDITLTSLRVDLPKLAKKEKFKHTFFSSTNFVFCIHNIYLI